MHPIKSIHVDDREIDPKAFVLPEMSLSSARGEMQKHRVVIAIDPALIATHLASAYAEWVRDSKEDDEQMGGPQDDLGKVGYPSLEALIGMPDVLGLVLDYLSEQLFADLTYDMSRPKEYWLDEITHCEADSTEVRLFGICYGHFK
jgi:hypothetical protein